MIVSVCSDKGSPGVSTLATVLGLVWPGPRVVVEADTAGSDLSFRLRPTAADSGVLGGHLAPDPSIASLATAARLGLTEAGSGALRAGHHSRGAGGAGGVVRGTVPGPARVVAAGRRPNSPHGRGRRSPTWAGCSRGTRPCRSPRHRRRCCC